MAITLDGTSGMSAPAASVAAAITSATVTTTGAIVSGTTITAGTTVADATAIIRPLVSGTAVASTSGTSIDFTGIPSWVKRITVMFSGVSTNGTSFVQVQIGSGSVSTSGYISNASYSNGVGAYSYVGSGFQTDVSNTSVASYARNGIMQIALLNSNNYVASGSFGFGSVAGVTTAMGGISPALSGALDRVRITTVNGTDTFDAGTINILYE